MPKMKFNPAPGWPPAPEGWLPPEDWNPPQEWPEAPVGWQFIIPADGLEKMDYLSSVRTARGQSRISEHAVPDTPAGQAANQVLWEGASSQLTGIGGGRYRLTRHHLYFETGVMRTDSQQIPVEHIYDVDVSQTMMQKGRGVSNVYIHISRPNGVQEVVTMENLTEAKGVQHVINEAVRARKLELKREETTHTYLGGLPHHLPHVAAPQSAPEEKQPDIIDQITRLGELYKADILTQEEFETKKAELLSRL